VSLRIAERKNLLKVETSAVIQGRSLILTLERHGVVMRQKGRPHAFHIPLPSHLGSGEWVRAVIGGPSRVRTHSVFD